MARGMKVEDLSAPTLAQATDRARAAAVQGLDALVVVGGDGMVHLGSNVVAGTALFLLSDLTLGVRRFVMTEPGPASDGLVMATYTAGQGLIALGVAMAIMSYVLIAGSPND